MAAMDPPSRTTSTTGPRTQMRASPKEYPLSVTMNYSTALAQMTCIQTKRDCRATDKSLAWSSILRPTTCTTATVQLPFQWTRITSTAIQTLRMAILSRVLSSTTSTTLSFDICNLSIHLATLCIQVPTPVHPSPAQICTTEREIQIALLNSRGPG